MVERALLRLPHLRYPHRPHPYYSPRTAHLDSFYALSDKFPRRMQEQEELGVAVASQASWRISEWQDHCPMH